MIFHTKSEMYNVNPNVSFYMVFDFIQKVLKRTPSKIFSKDFDLNLRTPFSITAVNVCYENSLPDISSFLLGFFKAIYRKFLSCTTEQDNTFQRHSTS